MERNEPARKKRGRMEGRRNGKGKEGGMEKGRKACK